MILHYFGAGLEVYQSTSCVINFEKVPLLAILAGKMESDGDFLHPICTSSKNRVYKQHIESVCVINWECIYSKLRVYVQQTEGVHVAC